MRSADETTIETSFVVIAYNEVDNIGPCIRSILAQVDAGTFEVIVVDDASNDQTAEVVRAMAGSDGRIRLLAHAANRGRGPARQTGVDAATGRHIAMVDADIVLPPTWLRQALAALDGYHAVGGSAVPDGDATYIANRFGLRPKVVAPTVPVSGNNGLYERAVFEVVKFEAGLREGEDVAANRAMEAAGLRLRTVPDLVCEHRERKGFLRSLRWMYQSGVGATRQLARYREIRWPDLALAGQVATVAVAVGVGGGGGSGRRRRRTLAWVLPGAYLYTVGSAHLARKFETPPQRAQTALAASVANSVLVGSYFAGRVAGGWVLVRRRLGVIRRPGSHASRPLRVGVVTDGLYPYFKGGKEVRFHELLRRVVRPGVAVDVYTMNWWNRPGPIRQDGVVLHPISRRRSMYAGERRSIVQAVMFAMGSLRLLTADVDVIDADHMPYLQLFPLRVVTWLKRVPLVVTWHEWWGTQYWCRYLGRAGHLAAFVERAAAGLADHLVVETSETKARLQAAGVAADRISVLGVGVDRAAIAGAPISPSSYDLLFVGRLISHKNVDLLVEAVAALRDDGVSLRCAVVGEGPELARIRALIEEHRLDGLVVLLGRLEHHDDVYGLMKRATTFVYPSVREGFGLAVLEALACGTQVITCDHPDNHARALVAPGRTGFLCRPDVGSLATAIRTASAAPLARADVIDEVAASDWSDIAGALLEVYRASRVAS